MSFESVIFSNLIGREEYGRKVLPFLRDEYFHEAADKTLFELINTYTTKYNKFPTKEALTIELANAELGEHQFQAAKQTLENLNNDPSTELGWLVENTEKFCQEKAIYNAIRSSIQILDKKDNKLQKGAIPQLLTDALSISFDTHIGHDWADDSEKRYDHFHNPTNRVPFDIDYLNRITKGGLKPKTLNVLVAGPNVGKSLVMCHLAAANMQAGYNVAYFTFEMAEEEIAERIDANLLKMTTDEIEALPKETFLKMVKRVRDKTVGKIKIKEYPTSSASVTQLRHDLRELKLKKNFVPQVIYVDYINIMSSSRVKFGGNINSYAFVKAIAEELRGLAAELGVPIVSATQLTRGGFSNSDPDMDDTAESFGLPATVDLMLALITNEELESLNQIMVKQLKSRYGNKTKIKRFVVGIDRDRMILYDCEQSAQDDISEDKPVMDNAEFGHQDSERSKRVPKKGRKFGLNDFG